MSYKINGIDPTPWASLVGLDDKQLSQHQAVRMIADGPGFPCRVTLEDVAEGTSLLLVNHISHKGNNPYRASHAIFITEQPAAPAIYEDRMPPAVDRRVLSLRAFDCYGMMHDAALAQPGEGDIIARRMLSDAAVDHIDAHTATRGCFMARIERS